MKQDPARSLSALCALVLLAGVAHPAMAQDKAAPTKSHSYATSGLVEFQEAAASGGVEKWKLLLDQSNLGGNELEMAELTLPAGEVVGAHHHGSIEILYVLSGTLGHEVNGEMHMLTPGMVGIVRPEDSVRHVVPKSGEVKLLVLWTPGGEAKKFFGHQKTTPVPQK
ncbi:MAG: cupin domain-containing protein [Proteobacteria bacterium]|nr:cupin domain-containing protein [Pseudomonadota bacterium]